MRIKSTLLLVVFLLAVLTSCKENIDKPDISLAPFQTTQSSEINGLDSTATPPPSDVPLVIETKPSFTYVIYEAQSKFEPCFTVEYACSDNILRYAYKHDEDTIKYGYMDMEFNVLSPPISDFPSIFTNGLAKINEGRTINIINKDMEIFEVKNHNHPFIYNGEWYIQYRIKQNINPVLDHVMLYYTGFKPLSSSVIDDADFLVPCLSDIDIETKETLPQPLWGYKTIDELSSDDSDNRFWTIPPMYEDAKGFNEGFAAVKLNGKWGYIDESGTLVSDCIYSFVNDFHNEVAIVVNELLDNGNNAHYKFGIINSNFEIISDFEYETIHEYKEGYAKVVEPSGNWTFIDLNGEKISDTTHLSMWDFNEGYAMVRDMEGYSFIDTSGNYINEAVYERAFGFSENLAAVKIGGKWGYIDTQGEIAIQPQYLSAGDFHFGYAFVTNWSMRGKSSFIIDRWGNKHLEELNLRAISEFNKDGYALAYSEETIESEIKRTYYIIHIEIIN